MAVSAWRQCKVSVSPVEKKEQFVAVSRDMVALSLTRRELCHPRLPEPKVLGHYLSLCCSHQVDLLGLGCLRALPRCPLSIHLSCPLPPVLLRFLPRPLAAPSPCPLLSSLPFCLSSHPRLPSFSSSVLFKNLLFLITASFLPFFCPLLLLCFYSSPPSLPPSLWFSLSGPCTPFFSNYRFLISFHPTS